jgi:serine/threonine protein kinase
VQPLQGQDPDRIAGYRLLGRLGEGGMGVVYLARSPRGRTVAVKTIHAELAATPDFRLRFAKETALARQVGGEWTAAVLDADPDAELPWVATAYVAGPTLHQMVAEQHGPLPEHSVRRLASGLCQALGHIHAAGLVHRDLKPSNVMVTIEGPKVIDFGIARALDSSPTEGLTSTGVVVGSPGFISPEQIRGERLTGASDIFSLGTVLAFASSGRLPFDAAEGRLHALMYRADRRRRLARVQPRSQPRTSPCTERLVGAVAAHLPALAALLDPMDRAAQGADRILRRRESDPPLRVRVPAGSVDQPRPARARCADSSRRRPLRPPADHHAGRRTRDLTRFGLAGPLAVLDGPADPPSRTTPPGHITCSTVVVDRDRQPGAQVRLDLPPGSRMAGRRSPRGTRGSDPRFRSLLSGLPRLSGVRRCRSAESAS